MKNFSLLCGTLILLLLPALLCGQENDSIRRKFFTPDSMIVKIDTLSVVPQSFEIKDVSKYKYLFDPISATIFLIDSNLLHQKLTAEYKTLSKDYSKSVFHKSPPLLENPARQHVAPDIPVVSFQDVFSDDRLYSNGSVSRGLSVGNNQDVVLNSSLNLQLSGKISDDVEILASISDKNIPIQPEGNTQFIQDINSIFITLKIKDRVEIHAGDVENWKTDDDFLRYSRNFLGLSTSVVSQYKDKAVFRNSAGGGVSKGKFTRQTLVLQNGVQGPYKLYGADNEINISIVAGSERVYLDGQMLTRGQNNDYVVDYNTAEISFTPNILVTSEKRIVVEFEYSDRHYVRYGLFSNNESVINGKHPTKLFVNFYHEQDLKNQSVQPELTNLHKLFLSTVGDNHTNAHFNNFDTVTFSPNQILYEKIDTNCNGTIYNIYRYSQNSGSSLYSPSFSYTGNHQGNYRLSENTVNGRVFEWVAPENGVMQGDYEPYLALTAPISQQMLTLGFESELRKQTKVRAEAALSNLDKNIFSKNDDKDNVGFSYNLNVSDLELVSSKSDTTPWLLQTKLGTQFVHKNFSPFESFRNIEFKRDFNLASDYSDSHSEWIVEGSFSASKHKEIAEHRFGLHTNALLRLHDSRAFRNEVTTDNRWNNWQLKTSNSILFAEDSIQKSRFLVSRIGLSKKFQYLSLGFDNLLEYNKFVDSKQELLRANSYSFNDFSVFMRSTAMKKSALELSYKNRVEYLPYEQILSMKNMIHEVKMQYKLTNVKNHSFNANVIYRNQSVYDSLKNKKNEHYFVGSLSYTGRFLKNAIIWNTYYEAGSGLEQKKTFTYLKVAKGQGTHVWNDYNGNGVEEVEEFEIASFQDQAEYIKVWIANDQYQNVYNNTLTQSLLIRPGAVWSNKSGFRKFISRFSNSTNLRSNLKHQTLMFSPFDFGGDDEKTVSNITNLSNNFSFNNNTSKFAFDYVVQKNSNKQFLYYGFEHNNITVNEVTLKSLVVEQVFVKSSFGYRQTGNVSTLSSRNFNTECYKVDGEIRLQFKNIHEATISGEYSMTRNKGGFEKINSFEVGASYSLRIKNRGTMFLTAQYVDIVGDAGGNSAVSYSMLNGLSVGRNFLWTADMKFSITEFLQLSLQYSGRAVDKKTVIHTGNVTINALF